MIFYSSKQLTSALLLSLGISFTTPAKASEYMVIGAEPDAAPNRSLYVMQTDDAYISKRMAADGGNQASEASRDALAAMEARTVRIVEVLQVFENAGNTDFIHYNLEFKCQQGLFSIANATSYSRADEAESRTSSNWMSIPASGWLANAEIIACNWKNWRAAKDAWQKASEPASVGKKTRSPAPSLTALGVEYLGDFKRWVDVVAGVWAKHWPDATQPPYVINRTPEEVAALEAKTLAIQNQARGVVAEQEKWTNVAINLDKKADRMGDDIAKEMSGIGGMTEQQVIAKWGAPAGFIESSGVRTLTYYYQKTQYGVDNRRVDIIGASGKIGETYEPQMTTSSRQCSRSLYLQEGGALEKAWRVYDFDAGCS
jgi:hypothetical protein